MTEPDLRIKIRELIASGVLPNDPPVVHRAGLGAVGARHRGGCAICGEPDPSVSYFWTGGQAIYLHVACDALWKQERKTPSA